MVGSWIGNANIEKEIIIFKGRICLYVMIRIRKFLIIWNLIFFKAIYIFFSKGGKREWSQKISNCEWGLLSFFSLGQKGEKLIIKHFSRVAIALNRPLWKKWITRGRKFFIEFMCLKNKNKIKMKKIVPFCSLLDVT